MTPRQPEVPNWIRVLVTASYCIFIRANRSCKRETKSHRKSKGPDCGAKYGEAGSAGDVRFAFGGSEDRAPRGRGAARRLREHPERPSGVGLPLEGQSRERQRVPSGDEDDQGALFKTARRHPESSQLRRA